MEIEVQNLVQTWFNKERHNHDIYAFCGDSFDNLAWDGFAKFMRKQAVDELVHASSVAEYLIAQNLLPEYHSLDAIIYQDATDNVLEYFKEAYNAEIETTNLIKSVADLALEYKDYQLFTLCDWFLNMQTNEIKEAKDKVTQISQADFAGRLLLDERYGE